MSDVKSAFETPVALTITLASLANNGARSCVAVDNDSDGFLDALVQIKIKSASSGTSTTGFVVVYAYASADGGTSYPEGTGTDTGVTLTVPTNLRPIGILNVVANSTTYISNPMSVAAAFGGILPAKWGIVIVNVTGATLTSTGSDHFAKYQPVWETVN